MVVRPNQITPMSTPRFSMGTANWRHARNPKHQLHGANREKRTQQQRLHHVLGESLGLSK